MKIHQIRRISSTAYMKSQKSYSQAKSGDIEAARKLISTVIHHPVKMNNKIDFVCPVMKPSGNRIPPEARQNLNEFKLGNDGMSSIVIIRDAAGREFKTSQNIVFSTVLKSIQEVLDEKIAETEEQINFAV